MSKRLIRGLAKYEKSLSLKGLLEYKIRSNIEKRIGFYSVGL